MPTLLDHNGNAFRKGELGEYQTADMLSLRRTFANHPAKGLTPQKLNSILVAAEQGNWTRQAELFVDMEQRCPHLFGDITKRKNAILGAGWEIIAPRNASPAENDLTGKVREAFDAIRAVNGVVFDLADGIGKGFGAVEYQWDVVDGRLRPEGFEYRPQTWFMVDHETRSEIRLRSETKTDGEPLRSNNWVLHRHRAMSGYVDSSALYRVLVWPFIYLAYGLRDFAEFLEIHGLPIRIGKYPAGSTTEEKRTLLRAVAEIGHSAAGIMPDTMAFELQEASTSSADPFKVMIEWAERSISKAILGATLTSQADGKSSTNALGNVHNEVRHDILESDARQLEATLLEQLIAPFVYFNIGRYPLNRLPFIQFNTKPKEDVAVWSTALEKLTSIGMDVPETWAREKLNIPAPREGEKVLRARAQPTPQPGTQLPVPQGAANDAGEPGEPGKNDGPAKPGAKVKQAAAATLGALFKLPGVVALRAIEGAANPAEDPDNPVDAYTQQLAADGAGTIKGWISTLTEITDRAAREGRSLDSLKAEFLAAFGGLDGDELQQAMGLAMATADLAGQLAVKTAAANSA